MEIENGEATELVIDKYYDIFEDEESCSKEEILKLAKDIEQRGIFNEGVAKKLNCDSTDKDYILSELKRRFNEKLDIKFSDFPKTIQRWISDGKITNNTNRKNNYDVCYALDMDLKETYTFFVKYYLTIPFNFKDKLDAINFYCISKGKPYKTVKYMIDKAMTFQNRTEISDTETEQTLYIGNKIREIEDDEEFIEFLSNNCYSAEQQYMRTKKKIKELVNKIMASNSNTINSIAELEINVMGQRYQASQIDKNVKEILPRMFYESLPQQGIWGDILKGNKKETQETLRKCLIILDFYDYYTNIESCEMKVSDYYREFESEISGILSNCGLTPLYVRNPFDLLIMYCAAHEDAISEFQEINCMRYKQDNL